MCRGRGLEEINILEKTEQSEKNFIVVESADPQHLG